VKICVFTPKKKKGRKRKKGKICFYYRREFRKNVSELGEYKKISNEEIFSMFKK